MCTLGHMAWQMRYRDTVGRPSPHGIQERRALMDTQWEGGQAPHTAGPQGPKPVAATPVPVPGPCARASVFVKGLCLGLVLGSESPGGVVPRPRPAPAWGCILLPVFCRESSATGQGLQVAQASAGHQKPSYTKGSGPRR